jgi:hypothetical protein
VTHHLVLVPLRHDVVERWQEVNCWLDPFEAVAVDCSCGWRLRLLTEAEIGPLDRFYGEVDEPQFERLTAEMDRSGHAVVMVDWPDLREPTGAAWGRAALFV